jgi:hypothetical protein
MMGDRLKKPERLSGDTMNMSSIVLTPIHISGERNVSDHRRAGSSSSSFAIKTSKVGYEIDGSVSSCTSVSMLEL